MRESNPIFVFLIDLLWYVRLADGVFCSDWAKQERGLLSSQALRPDEKPEAFSPGPSLRKF